MNKKLLAETVNLGDTVVDATLGNGNDALFLARLTGPRGKVIAFDIQEEAVIKSREKIQNEGIENVSFILDGHENLEKYVGEASAVVFNLGYLPGFSKDLTTKGETTLAAIKKAIGLLTKPGIITIMFYTGHPGGEEEKEQVLSYVQGLDKREYDVLEIKHTNGKETAPFLLIIYKKGE